MKKIMVLLIVISCLLTSCYAGAEDVLLEPSSINQTPQLIDVETSIFEQYHAGRTDTSHIIKGRVSQENDGNAVLVYLHAEQDCTIHLMAGDCTVVFSGESAVYDFNIAFELADGVSYSDSAS